LNLDEATNPLFYWLFWHSRDTIQFHQLSFRCDPGVTPDAWRGHYDVLERNAMPIKKLTARFVASVKPKGTRVEYRDAQVDGLALRVTESGSKSWTLRYRHGRRQRRMTIGTTEAFSLAKARAEARDVLYAAGKGKDPATVKQAGRAADTIGDLATLYIEKWAKPRKRSWKADDNLLRKKILPKWRHRRITEITRQDVRLLVEGVAEAGAPVVANRVAALEPPSP
jgi:hypothetical protein